jgi:selenide,water dikinase
MNREIRADLVLVGGGHAHVQVLRRWMRAPLPGVRLSVVLDRPLAVYSGMVPGFVAGDYAAHELEIDVVPLARRAGARVILARATGVDPQRRRIELEGRQPLAYDVASLDIGSTVRGLELPGVAEHALPTRPIGDFVGRVEARLQREAEADGAPPLRVAVVGSGAAGVELAFTLQARLAARGRAASVALLGDGPRVLVDQPARVSQRVLRAAARRGIEVRGEVRVTGVEKDAVCLEGGDRLLCDWVVWAGGAAAHVWLAEAPLPHDAEGFVRVDPTLQVAGHPDLFAVGDCAALAGRPWVRKAGVYAVRQGPVLDANLRAHLRGAGLRPHRPQRDFLTLLNLGAGEALGVKWGVALEGRWVWRWKDRIDRRFMRRFQVLAPDGSTLPEFSKPARSEMARAPCGGCAAKLEARTLQRALDRLPPPPQDDSVLVGLARPDDAAAVALPHGDVWLASVDAFRAFSDDPFLVGRVAAVNAVSDIFAEGGEPRHALALVSLPEPDAERAEETLFQVLAGVRAALDPLNVSLVGGHTTRGSDLYVGVVAAGSADSARDLLRLDGLEPGQRLILSKPLGTGVVLAAAMQGLASGAQLQAAHASMLRPNREALRVARDFGARACTDVTGFGLAGHLGEMLRASGTSAVLRLDALPALDGALALLSRGVRSSSHQRNARGRCDLAQPERDWQIPALELVFDPQTSGGLLFSIEESAVEDAVDALRAAGDRHAAAVGAVFPRRSDGALLAVE